MQNALLYGLKAKIAIEDFAWEKWSRVVIVLGIIAVVSSPLANINQANLLLMAWQTQRSTIPKPGLKRNQGEEKLKTNFPTGNNFYIQHSVNVYLHDASSCLQPLGRVVTPDVPALSSVIGGFVSSTPTSTLPQPPLLLWHFSDIGLQLPVWVIFFPVNQTAFAINIFLITDKWKCYFLKSATFIFLLGCTWHCARV